MAESLNQADRRSRALGMLAGYLWSKLGVSSDQLRSGLIREGHPFSPQRLKRFREGSAALSVVEYTTMANHILSLLKEERHYPAVLQDYAWLRPLFLETGLDADINQHGRDQIPLDRSFVRALNIDPRSQRQLKVYERIGGLWHLVRLSNAPHRPPDKGLFYNVALLNIKPTSYIASAPSQTASTINVRTLISHFSVRSRLGTDINGRLDIFRGRVFESDKVIYFIGDRRQYPVPKLFIMAWRTPQILETQSHADFAEGVIMTVTSDDATISGPIIARFVDRTMEVEVPDDFGSNIQLAEYHNNLSRTYDERITSQLENLRTVDTKTILEIIGKYNERERLEENLKHLNDILLRPNRSNYYRV